MVINEDLYVPERDTFVLSPEMERKMKVLEQFGFNPGDASVKATVMNIYPREHYYKFRTKMFQSEKDRINAY